MSRTIAEQESQILTSFLLSRASFQSIVSFKEFTSAFPKSLQKHPHLKSLYNNLALERTQTINSVKNNIAFEIKLSQTQLKRQRKLQQKQSRIDDQEALEDVDLDDVMEVYGTLPAPKNQLLPIADALKTLGEAKESMEYDMRLLDQDCDELVKEIEEIVWGLSSLKTGNFGKEDLVENVVQALDNLKDACESVLKDD